MTLIQNFYTLDMRCEYSGNFQLEAPSLQQHTANTYFCQCSVVHPSSDGFAILSAATRYGTCTLVITRCPLSQNVIN